MSNSTIERQATLQVSNVGGIDRTTVEIGPGVTVLTGRNATNRTSLLQAFMGVLGSEHATLKGDADHGEITLDIGGAQYSRALSRENDEVRFGGDPYLDDPTVADLFAFLLEGNRCRQAVARGDGLRELIMQPVDTDAIQSEIRSLEAERDEVDEELSTLDSLAEQLPELEEERQQLDDKINEKEQELSAQRERLAAADGTIEDSRAENEELDTKMEALQNARDEHTEFQRELSSERESIDALEDELAEFEATSEELSAVPEERLTSLTGEIQRIRGRIDSLNQTITELQSVIQFNDEFLDEDHPELLDQLSSAEESSAHTITDELVDGDEERPCWTCGETVPATQIEATLETLRSIYQEKREDRTALQDELAALEEEKATLEDRQQRYEQIERKRSELRDELAERQDRVESLEADQEAAAATISRLEDEVAELQAADHSELLERHETVNRLEFELRELEADRSAVESEISSIEGQIDTRTQLSERREEITTELADLRTRVQRLQTQAVDAFNEHMETVLDLLAYDNLERIWIEQTTTTVREGRQTKQQSQFELHIVRSTESGTVYEDTVEHLSESEREVTGIIFALAGYLTHEVYQTVPFLLLDSVEAIDSDRIARLVEHLTEYADYLVVALLTEDAAAIDERHARIRSI